MSKRRTKAQHGWVNFPVDDPRYADSGEGGLVVKLVVTDDRDESEWRICCGAFVNDMYSEVLVSHNPVLFYPYIDNQNDEWPHRYTSRDFLSIITLGITSWSGWDEEKGDYWHCTLDDLTTEGKELYAKLQELYKGCRLHLLTYLDT